MIETIPDLSALDCPELSALDLVLDDPAESAAQVDMPHAFRPRQYQHPCWEAFFEHGKRRFACFWHRRTGKDRTWWNIIACAAATLSANYLYIFPTYSQARKVIWNGIGADGFRYIDHIPESVARRHKQTMTFEFHESGSILQLAGSDDVDSLRGTNPQGVVFSEWQHCNPIAWDKIIRPILVENDGWAAFLWTAFGRNHAHRMRRQVMSNPQWFYSKLTVADTKRPDGSPVVSEEAIEEERRAGMSEEAILQEFWLSEEAANPGAYYGKQVQLAYAESRIRFVPAESALELHTFWDLGVGDYTAIWFMQAVGREFRFVNYIQDHGYALAHYVKLVKEWAEQRDLKLGEHWAPHDIEVRELGADRGDGRAETRKERASKLGVRFRVCPRIKKQSDGRDAVRAVLGRCWFDEGNCDTGLSALQSYGPDFDEKRQVYLDQPKHDWSSHGAKAFETFAVGWRDRIGRAPKTPGAKPRMRTDFDPLRG